MQSSSLFDKLRIKLTAFPRLPERQASRGYVDYGRDFGFVRDLPIWPQTQLQDLERISAETFRAEELHPWRSGVLHIY